jgi:hypothetical protein
LQPDFHLRKVLEIEVADEVSIKRQKGRLERVSIEKYTPEERLAYYNGTLDEGYFKRAGLDYGVIYEKLKVHGYIDNKGKILKVTSEFEPELKEIFSEYDEDQIAKIRKILRQMLKNVPDQLDRFRENGIGVLSVNNDQNDEGELAVSNIVRELEPVILEKIHGFLFLCARLTRRLTFSERGVQS